MCVKVGRETMDRIKYFSESDHKNTKNLLERCQLFIGAHDAINDLVKVGTYESQIPGKPFINQNDRIKDVYFLLEGEVDILINGRGIATRCAPTHIGEMAVTDPTARRSATVVPLENCILLRIQELDFTNIANRHPRVWQNIAAEIAQRLRQRGELVDTKEVTPRIFIGSSAEYLDVAYAIQEGLLHTDISVNVWSQDCFRPSEGTLAALEREALNSDFALFIFGNEDLVISRDEKSEVPRDNVIFELGLFIGKLSSQRVYYAKEIDINLKIPTDLLGISPINYRRKNRESLSVSVQPICNKLSKMAKLHGTK